MATRRTRTSPRREPSQKRAVDTVSVLLEATERVMASQGFLATTTNRIADAAGVSIGTLYHYFPSKEALVEAVVHRMWQRELSALEERMPLLTDGPLDAAIRALVETLVALMVQRIDLYKRWYSEAPHLGQLEHGLDITERGVTLLRAALAARRVEVRPENLDFATDLVVKTVLAVVRTGARDYPQESKSGELAAELSQMISRYLLVSPGGTPR